MVRTSDDEAPILRVGDLHVTFATEDGPALAVDGLSFELFAGETVGIVGESGSGKSATAMAVLGLLPSTATVAGSIAFGGRELLGAPERELRTVRGNRIAMVFQDALAALNPAHTVGRQLAEAIRVHDRSIGRAALRARAVELLETVGIPSPQQRVDQYPHEFSGGMRQRVMIAMSIANDPDVIIADEPTTALDVTVQAQVLEVLQEVQRRTRAAVLLITHDLGVVAGLADRVVVMYAGAKVEEAAVEPLFEEPSHPYTQGLLQSLPRLDDDGQERLRHIPGRPPNPTELPDGCRFLPRCPHALAGVCDRDPLPLATVAAGHVAACARIDAAREGWS
jgi:oligopeptide/dipeptide ABC transporter ATP-binding protein